MKKYRLKKEAVPFFKKELACAVKDWDFWTKTYNVDPSAIEEVEDCFITYGIEYKIGTSLAGWGNPNSNTDKNKIGSHFCFTVHFPSMKYYEHDKFTNGKMSRDLMNSIQRAVCQFYDSFNNGEL